jgi:cell division protein YceG involved in septum cleavage
MTKIHGKSVLLGTGLGIIFTALLGCIFFLGYIPEMDEAKVKSLAKKYGMIEPGELAQISVDGKISIEVEENDSLAQISKKLQDIGLVKETLQFQLKVLNQKAEDKIFPGVYEFTGNENEQEIINILTGK